MVVRAYRIPPLVLLGCVLGLAGGELASGTSLNFVSMMTIAMLSIGITYNQLGGLSSFSGIIFTAFALRTIVISQFAKVALWEAADKNLEVPALTISIYAVFYFSAMLGVWAFGHLRFRLPKPLEPSEKDIYPLYAICLSIGLAASLAVEFYTSAYSSDETNFNQTRSLGIAFAPLLLLALVVAVDRRIRSTEGRHSFGLAAAVPWLAAVFFGFIDSVRTAMLAPSIVYVAVCFLRGYRFRLRHYIAMGAVVLLFFTVISPLALYSRGLVAGRTLRNRVLFSYQALSVLNDRSALMAETDQTQGSREEYFSRRGTYVLSRLSLIRADSTIVDAAAGGARYGFMPTLIAAAEAVPRFLYKNKPTYTNAQDYIGHFAGMAPDGLTNTYTQFSAVGDSFGAFGWLGVILFPFFVFPLIFIIYESMFDLSQPWGTVMLGMMFFGFGEMMVHRSVGMILRDPIYLVLLSYLIGGIAKGVSKPARATFSSMPDTAA